jgi:CubicO group peptidase (beta-lactamase class C family)
MFSTIDDLARWDQALYTERLVSAATLREAWTPGQLSAGDEFSYGFGWFVRRVRGRREISHSGGLHVHSARMVRYPDARTTAVVLSADPRLWAVGLANQMAEIAIGDQMLPLAAES